MAKRRLIGFWLAAGTLFVMQAGGPAHGGVVVTGPSQGAIPDDDHAPAYVLALGAIAANQNQGGGGGGGGTGNDGARGPSPEAGTGGTSGGGGSRPDEADDRPVPGSAASPQGGGGGGGQRPANVIPVMPGNPDGIDAVPDPSPSPDPNGGGGGGGVPPEYSPWIRVLPGGDAADWARSPSPSPR
ncbi:MAG: hypothetical protein ACK46X_08080 [Candidatus Sericytochromatia bacterium]